MNKIISKFAIFITVVLTLSLISCSVKYFGDNEIGANAQEIQSKINSQKTSTWMLEKAQISTYPKLERFYFYDKNIIYGINYEKSNINFYKTEDGGISWKQISFITGFSIKDILFTSPNEGFIALSKIESSGLNSGGVIMKTEDGGISWKTVYSSTDNSVTKIIFDPTNGLAVGRKNTIKSGDSNLVLLTTDKGNNWMDISENLNRTALNTNGRIDDLLSNVFFSKTRGIVVLSIDGKIYNSDNLGRNWNLISKFDNEPQQTSFSYLGELNDGNLWVAGSAMSVEGVWGVIAIMNDNLYWKKFRLKNYYFNDVNFLSDDSVIAIGFNNQSDDLNKNLRTGVILYSLDRGENWTNISENQLQNEFVSMFKLSNNEFLIEGQNNVNYFLKK